MPSLGELFIELGVVGDVKPLEKANNTLKDAIKNIEKQIEANKRLLEYKEALKNATTKGDKALIKSNFVKTLEKERLEETIDANEKTIAGKKKLAKTMAGVVKGAGAVIAAFSGAVFALNKLSEALIQNNQAWINFTRQTDLGLQALQKYAGVAALLDASLGEEGAAGSIAQLEKRLFDLKLTGQGARGFILAGVNPLGQDAFGVIEQLRNRIKGLNNNAATYLLEQMGLDPRLLPLLRLTRHEFLELQRTVERYKLSDEQREAIQKLNIQLSIAGQKLKFLKDRIALMLLPAFVKLAGFMATIVEAFVKLVDWLQNSDTTAAKVTKSILAIAAAIGILTAALWAFTAHPIIAVITAALGALLLIIEDIMVYLRGGESVTGDIVRFFDELGQKFKSSDFSGAIQDLSKGLLQIGKMTTPPTISALIRLFELLLKVKDSFGAFDLNLNNNLSANNLLTPTGGYASNTNTNNSYYDNRQINMDNKISTSQPAYDIQREFVYTNAAFNNWSPVMPQVST